MTQRFLLLVCILRWAVASRHHRGLTSPYQVKRLSEKSMKRSPICTAESLITICSSTRTAKHNAVFLSCPLTRYKAHFQSTRRVNLCWGTASCIAEFLWHHLQCTGRGYYGLTCLLYNLVLWQKHFYYISDGKRALCSLLIPSGGFVSASTP